MVKSRQNIYESDDIQHRVSVAKRAMRELKQAQFIGTDSIRFYKRDTGEESDWSGVPPQSPQSAGSSTKVLRVTATALVQNVLFADLIAEQRIDSATADRHTVLDFMDELENGTVDRFDIRFYVETQLPGNENIVSWIVVLNGSSPSGSRPLNDQFFKCYVVANDEVDIVVTEVN